jgi:hypothetical protein
MATRKSNQLTISTSAPVGAGVGDEWLDPITGVLRKNLVVNNLVDWQQVALAVGGTISGTATTAVVASTVNTISQPNSSSYFLAFVDSSNATLTPELLYTTSSFSINPGTKNISAGGNILLQGSPSGITGTITWTSMQLKILDNGNAGSVFLNSGNPGLPSSQGSNNVLVGSWCAPTISGGSNTIIGSQAGYTASSGANNVYIGTSAAFNAGAASNSTVVGSGAGGGSGSFTAAQTVAFGYQTLQLSTGTRNIAFGYQAGNAITSGSYNVVIGSNSGSSISTSSGNVIISNGTGTIILSADSAQTVTIPGVLIASTNTNSTSTNTGALRVTGGIGVGGDAYVGGNVVMPNRPAFRVVGNGGAISATTTVTSSNWTLDYQQGSALNASTGIFTAPIAGLYQVNLVVRTNSNTSSTISQAIVRKTAISGGAVTSQIMVEFGTNTSMNHAGGSTIVTMAVGDTLKLDVTVGTLSFDGNDNWSVAYIG